MEPTTLYLRTPRCKKVQLYLILFNYLLIHSVFEQNTKTRNIILKTEQTAVAYTQWDRWASYDVIKHHIITTDVITKYHRFLLGKL